MKIRNNNVTIIIYVMIALNATYNKKELSITINDKNNAAVAE
jgi:hypothetical protein